jgi:predicted RNA binding protein YcfA (HicA-like mRNA interferase family)
MRIPRDISGSKLSKKLEQFGYVITRQTGSHIRLTSNKFETHHITIPKHSSLRIGTISSILKEVSDYLQIDKQELTRQLFK